MSARRLPPANEITSNPDIDVLAGVFADLWVDSTNHQSIEDALFNLSISQTNSVYNAMSRVDPTSLSSVESAIAIYGAMSVAIDDLLDLNKEDSQLDVVRDSLAATKCCVILLGDEEDFDDGDARLCSIGRDE